jgi:hypothetical protein
MEQEASLVTQNPKMTSISKAELSHYIMVMVMVTMVTVTTVTTVTMVMVTTVTVTIMAIVMEIMAIMAMVITRIMVITTAELCLSMHKAITTLFSELAVPQTIIIIIILINQRKSQHSSPHSNRC